MPGSYLLDTNAAIAVLEERVTLGGVAGDLESYLSLVVLAELFYGAFKSARIEQNLERVRRLTMVCPVIGPDEGTAELYGRIKAALRRGGRPIPDNDLWVAAVAIQHDLTLVTRDRHFDEVAGLQCIPW